MSLLSFALAVSLTATPSLWTESDTRKPFFAAPSVAPLVEKMEPAVLVVFTEGQAPDGLSMPLPDFPGGLDMPEGHPPLGGGIDEGPVRGQGAGFLITKSGYALTNHHVVEGATRVSVYVGDDHTEIDADVIGSDEKADVALIKLKGERNDWPFIPLADSDKVKVGDYVVAIGSPFGLEQSVSLGIISARGRRDIAPSGRQGLYDFLQTDASINPGNSGGPLLDAYGAVVGINAAVNAAGSGIGFAIPINMVKRMIPQLVEKGRYERSWIGVSIQPVDPDVVKGLGLTSTRGALVREVVNGGPAEKAGVKPGDVILTFDGRNVREANELPLLAGDAGVGTTVKLELVRDKKPVSLQLTLGDHPDNAKLVAKKLQPPSAELKSPDPKHASIGISVLSLDGETRTRLGVPKDVKGARVTKVRPGSPAFFAGVVPDDVVVSVNGVAVASGEDFADKVRATPSGELLKLSLRRGSSTIFAAVKKP